MSISDATLMSPAATPSGLPLASATLSVEDTVMTVLADVFSNPANPLAQVVRDQASDALQEARGHAVGYVEGLTLPTPGRTPTYYYCWAGGCGMGAALNYYAAWRADESMLARAIFLLQGTALVAASAVNLQKARRAGS